jgi:hypothetical protein
VPYVARRLVQRCLEKDPARRLQHIGDVRILVEEALAALVSPASDIVPSKSRRFALWMGVGVVLAALASGAIWVWGGRSATPPALPPPLVAMLPFEGRFVPLPVG